MEDFVMLLQVRCPNTANGFSILAMAQTQLAFVQDVQRFFVLLFPDRVADAVVLLPPPGCYFHNGVASPGINNLESVDEMDPYEGGV